MYGGQLSTSVVLHLYMSSYYAQTDWHYDGHNIAYKKPTLQFPDTYCEINGIICYGASLAVDGYKLHDFTRRSCTHTTGNNKTEASWMVNLQKAYSISGIIIFNRNEVKERLQNFQVYGDSELIHNSYGLQEYTYSVISIPLDGTRSFQWIKILLPVNTGYSVGGKFYLSLCEVEVFAVPRPACRRSTAQIINGHADIYQSTGKLIDGQYTVGAILEFQCWGNRLLNGSPFIKCLDTGSYNTSLPMSCLDVCQGITHIPNGHVTSPSFIYTDGNPLTVVCDTGYETKTTTIYCRSGGIWDSSIPKCHLVLCPSPGEPQNGYYQKYNQGTVHSHLPDLPFGTVINGQCNTGYEGNDNQSYRTCQSDKSWSGKAFECTPVVCPHPRNIENGFYKFKNGSKIKSAINLHYQTIIYAACNEGYKVSSQVERRCRINKTWSGEEPYCNIVACDFPGDFMQGRYVMSVNFISENDKLSTYDQGQLNFTTQITAICDKGYTSVNSIRSCNSSGLWTGETPSCFPITCNWPLVIDNGRYEPSQNATTDGMPYNTTVTVVCNDMYTLSDDFRPRRCNEELFNEGGTMGDGWGGSQKRKLRRYGFASKEDVAIRYWFIYMHLPLPELEQDASNAAVIGGSLAAVGIILVLCLLAFMFYRRRNGSKGWDQTCLQYWIEKIASEKRSSANTQVNKNAEMCATVLNMEGSRRGRKIQEETRFKNIHLTSDIYSSMPYRH